MSRTLLSSALDSSVEPEGRREATASKGGDDRLAVVGASGGVFVGRGSFGVIK